MFSGIQHKLIGLAGCRCVCYSVHCNVMSQGLMITFQWRCSGWNHIAASRTSFNYNVCNFPFCQANLNSKDFLGYSAVLSEVFNLHSLRNCTILLTIIFSFYPLMDSSLRLPCSLRRGIFHSSRSPRCMGCSTSTPYISYNSQIPTFFCRFPFSSMNSHPRHSELPSQAWLIRSATYVGDFQPSFFISNTMFCLDGFIGFCQNRSRYAFNDVCL